MREPTGSTFMLRCAELGLSDEALEDMTCGMVYDLMIEKANDAEQYAIKGRPAACVISSQEVVRLAENVKGIVVEIGGDTKGLSKAISSLNSEIRGTQSELNKVNRLLKLDRPILTCSSKRRSCSGNKSKIQKTRLKASETPKRKRIRKWRTARRSTKNNTVS